MIDDLPPGHPFTEHLKNFPVTMLPDNVEVYHGRVMCTYSAPRPAGRMNIFLATTEKIPRAEYTARYDTEHTASAVFELTN